MTFCCPQVEKLGFSLIKDLGQQTPSKVYYSFIQNRIAS